MFLSWIQNLNFLEKMVEYHFLVKLIYSRMHIGRCLKDTSSCCQHGVASPHTRPNEQTSYPHTWSWAARPEAQPKKLGPSPRNIGPTAGVGLGGGVVHRPVRCSHGTAHPVHVRGGLLGRSPTTSGNWFSFLFHFFLFYCCFCRMWIFWKIKNSKFRIF
jgi:hypothetical protein